MYCVYFILVLSLLNDNKRHEKNFVLFYFGI